MRIGSALREQRLRLGLSVTEAASIGDVPRSYLSMVETGKRAPNPEVLVRFTRKVNIPKDVWMPVFLEDERRCSRLLALGRALVEEGDFETARKALGCALFASRRVRDGRYNSELYKMLGRTHYALGHYRQALRWFTLQKRAVRHSGNTRMQAATSYNIAQCMTKVGRDLEAMPMFDEAIRIFTRLRLWMELGKAWLAKGNYYLSRRSYREAFPAYRRAAHFLRGKPLHGDALLGAAITTWQLRGIDTARPLFDAIVASEHSDVLLRAKARLNLAIALRGTSRLDEALRELEIVLADRERLPSRLAAIMLAEETLCHVLRDDTVSARLALEGYKAIPGEKDTQDIAAMRILARVLGASPPPEELRESIWDEHDHRFAAAMAVLQARSRRQGSTLRSGVTGEVRG